MGLKNKDQDLGRVIDELSREYSEAYDAPGVSAADARGSPDSDGTKGERGHQQCKAFGVATGHDRGGGIRRDGGHNDTQGDTKASEVSPMFDSWVLSFAALGLIILVLRLIGHN